MKNWRERGTHYSRLTGEHGGVILPASHLGDHGFAQGRNLLRSLLLGGVVVSKAKLTAVPGHSVPHVGKAEWMKIQRYSR